MSSKRKFDSIEKWQYVFHPPTDRISNGFVKFICNDENNAVAVEIDQPMTVAVGELLRGFGSKLSILRFLDASCTLPVGSKWFYGIDVSKLEELEIPAESIMLSSLVAGSLPSLRTVSISVDPATLSDSFVVFLTTLKLAAPNLEWMRFKPSPKAKLVLYDKYETLCRFPVSLSTFIPSKCHEVIFYDDTAAWFGFTKGVTLGENGYKIGWSIGKSCQLASFVPKNDWVFSYLQVTSGQVRLSDLVKVVPPSIRKWVDYGFALAPGMEEQLAMDINAEFGVNGDPCGAVGCVWDDDYLCFLPCWENKSSKVDHVYIVLSDKTTLCGATLNQGDATQKAISHLQQNKNCHVDVCKVELGASLSPASELVWSSKKTVV
jgi:hypothetical protein